MNFIHLLISKISALVTVITISFGISQAPISEPVVTATTTVEVAVDSSTTTIPVTITPATIATVPLMTPVVITSSTTQATTSPPIATATPVVVPVVSLPTPTTNQVATPVSPTVIYIQVEQPQTPVASAVPTHMGEPTYTLKKGEDTVLDSVLEKEVRDYAESLNEQLNWRKVMQTGSIEVVTDALLSNGYTLTQN